MQQCWLHERFATSCPVVIFVALDEAIGRAPVGPIVQSANYDSKFTRQILDACHLIGHASLRGCNSNVARQIKQTCSSSITL